MYKLKPEGETFLIILKGDTIIYKGYFDMKVVKIVSTIIIKI